jgi:homogentisate 1,2-dioxygenase
MSYYRQVGSVPRKRHTVHRGDDGRRLPEELVGQHGFSGASSLLYHRHSPSEVVEVAAVDSADEQWAVDVPVVPRHLRTGQVAAGGDVVTGRRALLGNDDVVVSWVAADTDSPLYRSAVGDELVYVQSGAGRLESQLGVLDVAAGDYVVVPSGVVHRWVVGAGPLEVLVVVATGHVGVPRRYLSAGGQLLEHAPFCERDLRVPGEPLLVEADGPVDVLVRTRAGAGLHRMRHHPFDVVGWDGCVYPWALSIHDFEPIVGRIHQPPPVHQTFEGPGFVVCSFVPRLLDFHPDAVKVPYHHANIDSDEVLFYSAGQFTSRAGSGIGVGSISFHPAGFVHGPQPGSWEASLDRTATEEVAVMVDTFRPLRVSATGRAVSAAGYLGSWLERG